jgi:uncharacterized coiled-coil protein SlyX
MSLDETRTSKEAILAEGIEHLTRQLAEKRKAIESLNRAIGLQNHRLQKAESAEREMAKERDHWRELAKKLEARLKSHGIDAK